MLRTAVYTRIKQSSVGQKARQWFRSCSSAPLTSINAQAEQILAEAAMTE
jgi:hypothetical protein